MTKPFDTTGDPRDSQLQQTLCQGPLDKWRGGQRSKSAAKSAVASKDGVQGEGNYEAARKFNEAERKIVASGKVAAAARAAAPKSEAERQAMFAAEEGTAVVMANRIDY